MVVLRATKKVLQSLQGPTNGESQSDTALGDWYVNRVVVDRRPLLMFVSSLSLLAILEPARKVRALPSRLPDLVRARLMRLNIPDDLVKAEIEAMQSVRVGRTVNRSVVGTLVDFGRALPYYLPQAIWDDSDLRIAEDRFAKTPCRCSSQKARTIWPDREAVALLRRSQMAETDKSIQASPNNALH